MIDPLKYARDRFPFLSVEEVSTLIKESRLVRKKRGEILVNQGELNYNAFFLLRGLVRAYCINNEGEERTIVFRGERTFVGSLPTMIFEQPAVEIIEAIEDCIVLEIDFRTFRQFSQKSLPFSRAYSSMLEEMLQEAIDRINDFVVLNPEQRYLKFMKDYDNLIQRIPLKYIASYIGITVPSLSRIRKRIATKGN